MKERTRFPHEGFDSLWELLVADALTKFDRDQPVLANAVRALLIEDRGKPDALARAQSLVTSKNLDLPNRRAIEAGAAYVLALAKLRNTARRSSALAAAPPERRDHSELDMVIDAWFIYLQRSIETASKFVRETAKQLAPGAPGGPKLMRELGEWERDKKTTLSKGRQEATHGNTDWIKAIGEEGIWQVMILGSDATPQLVRQTMTGHDQFTDGFVERWDGFLQQAANAASVESDQWCERVWRHCGGVRVAGGGAGGRPSATTRGRPIRRG
jgi:hypothetical protein